MNRYVVAILLLFSLTARGQQGGESWEQIYQELMNVEDADDESEWTETYELLEALAQQPIDLNTATRDDLEQLPFLSEEQVMDFIEYRDRYGALRSMGELRMVQSMDFVQIRLLPFFTYVGDVDEAVYENTAAGRNRRLWQSDEQAAKKWYWWHTYSNMPHKLTATGRLPLYRRKGDRAGYLGYPYRHWLRYEYNTGGHLKFGVGGAQDAGEPFFAGRNSWGYDSYSYYFQLKRMGVLENLVAGKYKVSAGMGLILNNSFSLGKVAMLQNLGHTVNALRPHSSGAESDYFQGAGATLHLGKALTLTAFASHRAVDGTLNVDGSVATLIYSGYHRTENEMQKKYNTHLSSGGGSLTFYGGPFRIGVNTVYTHIDRALSPDRSTLYRRYYAHGRDFVNVSVDYGYSGRRLKLRGETAIDGHGAVATINVLSGRLSRNVSTMLMQRFYSCRYTTLHGHCISDGGRVQNESGLYLGVNWRASAALQFTAYADYAYSPWARYLVSQSSHAYDFFLQGDCYLPCWHLQSRVRAHLRQHDNDAKTALVDNDDYRGRLSATYNIGGRLELKTKTQIDAVRAFTPATSSGLMLSQQATAHCGHWQLWALAAVFDTDDYRSRLNIYEHQLPGNFSFPMFFGEGLRLCALAAYEPTARLRLSVKVGYTSYFDRTAIGTGLQQTDHSSMTDIDVQMRLRL